MSRFLERWRRRLARRGLITETVFYLLCARFALAIFSFQQLIWFFERPARQPELTGDARVRTRKEVRSAIIYTHHRVLFKQTTCFHRAIAAQAMLRRRGVSTTLYYGAARRQIPSEEMFGSGMPERDLARHIWVQDGAEGVVGYITAQQDRYHILARYPDSTSPM